MHNRNGQGDGKPRGGGKPGEAAGTQRLPERVRRDRGDEQHEKRNSVKKLPFEHSIGA